MSFRCWSAVPMNCKSMRQGSGTAVSTAVNNRALLFDGQNAYESQLHGAMLREIGRFTMTGVNRQRQWYCNGQHCGSGRHVCVRARARQPRRRIQQYAYFRGTLYYARLFSTARTASQILASYNSDISRIETGLVANWRFDDLSESGVTTESVSGNTLNRQKRDWQVVLFASTKPH